MRYHETHRTPASAEAARELDLYAMNTGELRKAIIANFMRKHDRGIYHVASAVKAWEHWMEAAAKRYCKEGLGSGAWHKVFPAATRTLAAKAREANERRNFAEYAAHGGA